MRTHCFIWTVLNIRDKYSKHGAVPMWYPVTYLCTPICIDTVYRTGLFAILKLEESWCAGGLIRVDRWRHINSHSRRLFLTRVTPVNIFNIVRHGLMVWNNKLFVYFISIEIRNPSMLKFAHTVSKTNNWVLIPHQSLAWCSPLKDNFTKRV